MPGVMNFFIAGVLLGRAISLQGTDFIISIILGIILILLGFILEVRELWTKKKY